MPDIKQTKKGVQVTLSRQYRSYTDGHEPIIEMIQDYANRGLSTTEIMDMALNTLYTKWASGDSVGASLSASQITWDMQLILEQIKGIQSTMKTMLENATLQGSIRIEDIASMVSGVDKMSDTLSAFQGSSAYAGKMVTSNDDDDSEWDNWS